MEKMIQCLYFKIISWHIFASPTMDFTSPKDSWTGLWINLRVGSMYDDIRLHVARSYSSSPTVPSLWYHPSLYPTIFYQAFLSSSSIVLSDTSPSFLRSAPLVSSNARTTSTSFPGHSLWFLPLSLFALFFHFLSCPASYLRCTSIVAFAFLRPLPVPSSVPMSLPRMPLSVLPLTSTPSPWSSCSCIYKWSFKCYVTLVFWKLDSHPPPRNANNIEPYTFVKLFPGKVDTPTPPELRNTWMAPNTPDTLPVLPPTLQLPKVNANSNTHSSTLNTHTLSNAHSDTTTIARCTTAHPPTHTPAKTAMPQYHDLYY